MQASLYREKAEPGGLRGPSGPLLRWAALVLCAFVIWAFMFVLAPRMEEIPAVGSVTGYVRESGIEAGALYYTEVEEAYEAEMYLRDSEEYAPAGP